MTHLDLNNPNHIEALVTLGEEGMRSGISVNFDIDAFIEETDVFEIHDTPKDPE